MHNIASDMKTISFDESAADDQSNWKLQNQACLHSWLNKSKRSMLRLYQWIHLTDPLGLKDGKTDEKFGDESMAVGSLDSPYQLMKYIQVNFFDSPQHVLLKQKQQKLLMAFVQATCKSFIILDAHCQDLRYIVIFKFETVCRLLSLACMQHRLCSMQLIGAIQ